MKERASRFLRRYSVLFLVVILLVFLWTANIKIGDVISVLFSFRIWQILVLIGIFVTISLNMIFKSIYILNSLGLKVRFWNISLIYFSSALAQNSSPGKIGYPVTAYLLKKIENIEYARSSAMLTVDFIVCNCFTGLIAVAGSTVYIKTKVFPLSGLMIIGAVIVCLFLILSVYLKKGDRESRIHRFLREVGRSIAQLKPKNIGVILLFYGINTFLSASFLLAIISFLGSSISVWKTITADSSSFILGALSMIPMGLGVQDASMLFYLSAFGLSRDLIVAVVMTQRLLVTGLIYLAGFAAGIALGTRKHLPA